MKEYNYKSYKRIHKYSHESDVEKEKISRETSNYVRYQKKADQMIRRLVNEIDEDDMEEITEESEGYEYASQKEIRNAKVHKNRLKSFQKHGDID
jgi:hypothetical protein